MTNNKPLQFKEFWIYKISPGVTRVSDSKVTLDDEYFGPPDYDVPIFPTKVIHVVEYSAYDKAQQEIAELKAKLLEFEGMTFSENEEIEVLKKDYGTCSAERDTLKSKCARFETELRFYSLPNNYETGPSSWERSGPFMDGIHTCDISTPVLDDRGRRARQALEVKNGK